MRDLGWVELRQPWSWRHPALRTRVTPKPDQLGWKPKVDAIMHDMRESWRHSCFQKWLAQPRIDSVACAGLRYNPHRLSILRDRCWSSHEFAVLTGAAVSPARLRVVCRDSPLGCPYCDCSPAEADWMHCAWSCVRAPRPDGIHLGACFDSFQSRMGWPSGRIETLGL